MAANFKCQTRRDAKEEKELLQDSQLKQTSHAPIAVSTLHSGLAEICMGICTAPSGLW